MLQTLSFLAGGRQIDAKATFFRYESASANGADDSIRVRADGNDLGLYLPGDAVELPIPAKRWEIKPTSPGTVGVVRLGIGRVQSARLVGTVSVVDTRKATTEQGLSFLGSITGTGGAAQFSTVQVWNPAASGKRAVIESIGVNAPANTPFFVGFNAAQQGAQISAFGNKRSGAGLSQSVWFQKTDHGADPIALVTTLLYSTNVGANGSIQLTPQRPLILNPGAGLLIGCRVAATTITAAPDFYEEAI